MAEKGLNADWTRSYSAPVVDEDEERQKKKAVDDAFMREVAEAWGMSAPGCSHDHRAEQRIFDLTEAQKATSCAFLLRCGDGFLSESQPSLAHEQYRVCLAYSEYSFPTIDEEVLAREVMRVRAIFGLAVCDSQRLPNPDWAGIESHCRQVVSALPSCTKRAARHDGTQNRAGFSEGESQVLEAAAWQMMAQVARARSEFGKARACLNSATQCLIDNKVSWGVSDARKQRLRKDIACDLTLLESDEAAAVRAEASAELRMAAGLACGQGRAEFKVKRSGTSALKQADADGDPTPTPVSTTLNRLGL